MNVSVSPSTSVRKSCGPLKPTVNDWSRKRCRTNRAGLRAQTRPAPRASPHVHERWKRLRFILIPSQKWLKGAALKERADCRSGPMKRWWRPDPSTAFADETSPGTPASRGPAALEGDRGFSRGRRGQKPHSRRPAGRRNFRNRFGIGCDFCAGARPANSGKTIEPHTRRLTPETSSILVRSPTKPVRHIHGRPLACMAIASISPRRGVRR